MLTRFLNWLANSPQTVSKEYYDKQMNTASLERRYLYEEQDRLKNLIDVLTEKLDTAEGALNAGLPPEPVALKRIIYRQRRELARFNREKKAQWNSNKDSIVIGSQVPVGTTSSTSQS